MYTSFLINIMHDFLLLCGCENTHKANYVHRIFFIIVNVLVTKKYERCKSVKVE